MMVPDRSIRVFVSSTFRDMMAERDYLVKFIFPQLRNLCAQRGVTWGEVDLRWGIPDEDQDDVLFLCLEEIQRCHPYFIGLLGERYGYIPKVLPNNVIDKYPWLNSHSLKSITELEIRFGCLLQDRLNPKAHIYFRDPGYLDRLPSGSYRADFECATNQDSLKLAQLKQEIREAASQRGCILREKYQDIHELGEWILEDFTRLIDQEFPAENIPDPLGQEKVEHLIFAHERAHVYIQRPEIYARLDSQMESNKTPFVVVGEPGVGKSALLANWYLQYTERNPGEFVLMHFIGSSKDSAEPIHILRRIMLELKRHPATQKLLSDEIPTEPDSIRQEFPRWIDRATSAGRIILILDGLDHLNGENAFELGWLPDKLPPECKLFFSTTPGRVLDIARQRGWDEMTLLGLSIEERRKVLVEYLAIYGRKLSTIRVERIISAEQTANPLFLRTLLEELRQFGEHNRLEERIEYYLKAQTLTQLFVYILQRLEQDYQSDIDLVPKSLSWIACARRGLAETELLEMLGKPGQPMPIRRWTPFSLAIEPFMVRVSGLLNFSTPYLRQAVERRYLSSFKKKQQCHLRIATYFEFLPLPTNLLPGDEDYDRLSFRPFSLAMRRVIDELPWQQAQAKAWESLIATLTLIPLFEVAYLMDGGLEWLAYWQILRKAEANGEIGFLNIPGRYLQEFQELKGPKKLILAGALGQFLKDGGFTEAAEEYFRAESEYYSDETPIFLRASSLNDQAQLLEDQNKSEQALVLFEEAEKLLRKDLGIVECRHTLASVLMNYANLLGQLGVTENVENKLQEALALMKETTGEDSADVATVLQSLGNYALRNGETQKAFILHQQTYELRLKRLGPNHRDVGLSLYNLGNVFLQDGKIYRSLECIQRAVEIFQEILGPEHTYTRIALKSLEQIHNLEQ